VRRAAGLGGLPRFQTRGGGKACSRERLYLTDGTEDVTHQTRMTQYPSANFVDAVNA
jgi:hypothetical protein